MKRVPERSNDCTVTSLRVTHVGGRPHGSRTSATRHRRGKLGGRRCTGAKAALIVHALLVSAVLILPVAEAQARREIAFPDLPGKLTLKCDFHMHTVFSDGNVWPTVRVKEAWEQGLDALAITDHVEYQPHKEDVSTKHERPYELAADSARRYGLLLVRGAEITRDTPPGHFNAIFLQDIRPLDTKDLYAVFDAAAAQGAFIFWNHPEWKGLELGKWGEVQQTLLEKKQLHGIEICNGDVYQGEAHRMATERKLCLLGNSDSHDPIPELSRSAEDHRTLTLVFAKERTLAALHEALSAGRTAVWCKNQLIGRADELLPLCQACVQVAPPHHHEAAKYWMKVENRCELDIRLERTGKIGPTTIDLPAKATTLIRVDVEGDELPKELLYRTSNFLVGPGQPLEVKLGTDGTKR